MTNLAEKYLNPSQLELFNQCHNQRELARISTTYRCLNSNVQTSYGISTYMSNISDDWYIRPACYGTFIYHTGTTYAKYFSARIYTLHDFAYNFGFHKDTLHKSEVEKYYKNYLEFFHKALNDWCFADLKKNIQIHRLDQDVTDEKTGITIPKGTPVAYTFFFDEKPYFNPGAIHCKFSPQLRRLAAFAMMHRNYIEYGNTPRMHEFYLNKGIPFDIAYFFANLTTVYNNQWFSLTGGWSQHIFHKGSNFGCLIGTQEPTSNGYKLTDLFYTGTPSVVFSRPEIKFGERFEGYTFDQVKTMMEKVAAENNVAFTTL